LVLIFLLSAKTVESAEIRGEKERTLFYGFDIRRFQIGKGK